MASKQGRETFVQRQGGAERWHTLSSRSNPWLSSEDRSEAEWDNDVFRSVAYIGDIVANLMPEHDRYRVASEDGAVGCLEPKGELSGAAEHGSADLLFSGAYGTRDLCHLYSTFL
jgi:hypothetical protein